MNMLGDQGWELITVLFHPDVKGEMTWTGFFKRPSDRPVRRPAKRRRGRWS